jgi:hypothetical protein
MKITLCADETGKTAEAIRMKRGTPVMNVPETDITFVRQPGGLQAGPTVIVERRRKGNERVSGATEVGEKFAILSIVTRTDRHGNLSIAGMVVTANIRAEIGKVTAVADRENMKGIGQSKPWIEEPGPAM